MRGPLRYELTKYRKGKRRPLSGVVPGIPYNSFGSSRRPVSGLPHLPRRPSYSHDSYNWALPRDYHPSLNAPAVQADEYDPYEPLEAHHFPRPNNPRLPHGLNDSNQEMPIPISLPEDDSTQTEQFLTAMGKMDEIEQVVPEGPFLNINEQNLSEPAPIESQLPVEKRSIDELPSLEDLKDAFIQLSDVLPDDHPDLVNVRTAMRKVRDHQISLSEMNETDATGFYPIDAEMENDPPQLDPHQEAEQFFNQQMELLEKSFDEPATEPIEVEASDLFENNAFEPALMPDGTLPDTPFVEEQTLEQIVQEESPFEAPAPEFMEQDIMPDEMLPDVGMPYAMPEPAGYDTAMIADEINQAIDDVSQQPMPQEMEPDSFQPQYDPYMMGQDMFDQMQYMADPFAMPGPCGSMGPMPGP